MMDQEVENLIADFADAAKRHREATIQGHWREADTQARRVDQAFRQIVNLGDQARRALLAAVDNVDPAVAVMAATYSLKYDTQRAKGALQRLSTETDLLGLVAQQALERWEEGTWQLDNVPNAGRGKPDAALNVESHSIGADVETMLRAIPRTVAWEDVVQFELLAERVAAVERVQANIIGMNKGSVEWLPDSDPPTLEESLAWWWVVRPDLGAAIAYLAGENLRREIVDYMSEYPTPLAL